MQFNMFLFLASVKAMLKNLESKSNSGEDT
jgi:hypothetical protein